MLKVTTISGKVYEGEAFALDPVTHSLAIKEANGVYSIINSEQIINITGNLGEIKVPDAAGMGLNVEDIRQQEELALHAAEKSLDAINLEVPGEVQALYDRINLIFGNCSWRGKSIEVLSEYRINPPYDTVSVMTGKDGSGLDRLAKFVSFILHLI
jgi:hypothetical protein